MASSLGSSVAIEGGEVVEPPRYGRRPGLELAPRRLDSPHGGPLVVGQAGDRPLELVELGLEVDHRSFTWS